MKIKKILKSFRRSKKERYKIYSDKEIFEYAEKLIAYAEIDFKTANILNKFDHKLYSQILYHIQQSLEKLSKAELILRNQIHIDELKKIGHITPKIFMLALSRATKDKEIAPFLKEYRNINAELRANKLIKNPAPKEILNTNKEELLNLIYKYDHFKKNNLQNSIYINAMMEKRLKHRLRRVSEERTEVYMTLFFLSWIVFPHATISRYPNKTIKPFDYNKTKGFVQVIPDLIIKNKHILKIMKKYKFENIQLYNDTSYH